MLVLTRRTGESVILFDRKSGDLIGRLTLDRTDGSKSRISFDFPASIGIAREELVEIDHENNEDADGAGPNRVQQQTVPRGELAQV